MLTSAGGVAVVVLLFRRAKTGVGKALVISGGVVGMGVLVVLVRCAERYLVG